MPVETTTIRISGEVWKRLKRLQVAEIDGGTAPTMSRLVERGLDAIEIVPNLAKTLGTLVDAIDSYTIEVGKVERGECEYANQGDLYDCVEQARAALERAEAALRKE